MVTGVTVDEAIAAFGKKGKTCTKNVIAALRKLGYDCADRLTRKTRKNQFPKLSIAHVKCSKEFQYYEKNKYWGHWVVIYEGKIYDPLDGTNPVWPKGIIIASFLEVYGKR